MPQKNRLRAEGRLAGRGRVRNRDSATEFQRGISPPNSGDRSFTALISLIRDAGLQGVPGGSVKCSGVKGNPPYLGCHFPLLEPRDHRGTAFPRPPEANTAGPEPPPPPEKVLRARKRSQVPPAALHQRRTTASHGCGEAGHTWGPARGKSWPTASPRDTRPDSAVH